MDTSIKSSQRTLALFELFSLEQRPLTIKQITDALDIPQSSASVLTKSLVSLGYLEKNEQNRTYYPTLRVSLLGTWMRRQHQRAGQLPALLSEVARLTGESTILAMRNGMYSQYLIAQKGSSPTRAQVESGMLYPLACCSTGWCLLTLERKDVVGKIVRRTISEAKEDYWRETARNAIEQVQLTQSRGYAFSKGETMRGLGAIAILLPSMPGAYAMSAGCGGRIERVEAKKDLILDALNELARSVRTLKEREEHFLFS
ncbi:IclR family transcriptional regulator [Hyphomonas adhaerens MHS-3]|uniref:IclR family transcriptional regulator n=1 Tax=Hyphomonas adhaerens MHS-3 TaxID=1280949 RepID=A0A069E6Y0_9PROT|nr:helix-turn-helix domain-containing protein [Hyphomonas adhaerens]KCZ86050.1 IclR family transcriptional regulator [Hyphomonas adhaerens MHS-3]